MAKFPFVVEPRAKAITERLGSEDAGYIEIKRQGYLSVAERSAHQQISSNDESTSMILGLTRKVSVAFSIDLEAAYKAVTAALTGRYDIDHAADIHAEYAEDLATITAALTYADSNQRLIKAYVMLALRIDSDISYEDMAELHPDLLDALAALFDDEDIKSTEKLTRAMREGASEEDVQDERIGELEQAEKKPRSKGRRASTSAKSSGT